MVCNQCSEQLCAETLTFSWTNMTSLSPAVLKSLCISRINQQSGLRSKCGQANACQDVFSVLNHSGLHTWTEIKCSPVYHQSGQTHYFKSGTAAHQLPCCFDYSSRRFAFIRKGMLHQGASMNVFCVKLAQG